MRLSIFRVFLVVGVVVLLLFFFVARPSGHTLVLKSYFKDAMGLRAGAPVRMAGVDVGSVRSVRVHPEMKEESVEVIVALTALYDLKIPNDSTAMLATAGVLGETYLAIDAVGASGPP